MYSKHIGHFVARIGWPRKQASKQAAAQAVGKVALYSKLKLLMRLSCRNQIQPNPNAKEQQRKTTLQCSNGAPVSSRFRSSIPDSDLRFSFPLVRSVGCSQLEGHLTIFCSGVTDRTHTVPCVLTAGYCMYCSNIWAY